MGMFVPRNMGIHMEGIYGDQSLHIISFIYKKKQKWGSHGDSLQQIGAQPDKLPRQALAPKPPEPGVPSGRFQLLAVDL
jgi:hypothetical protein